MGPLATSTLPTTVSLERIVGLGAVACAAVLLVGCGGREQRGGADTGSWTVSEPDAGGERDTTSPPEDTDPPQKTTGKPCSSGRQCAGGACLPDDRFPGGYCTSYDCKKNGCSGRDAVCVQFRGESTGCLAGCSNHDECRDGYSCQVTDGGRVTACLPGDPAPPMTFGETREVLDVSCQPRSGGMRNGRTRYLFDFSVDKDVNAFLMVPYVSEGTVRPVSLETPRATVDIRGDYRHHNARLSDLRESTDMTGVGTFGKVAFDWPILVPYAPQYADYLVAGGDYTVEVLTDEATPCLYVLENRPGRTLDVNFYFVGANGLDAENGPSDPDLAAAVDELERIYKKAGVEIGNVRYRDVSEEVVAKYRRITSHEEAKKLTAFGEPPSGALPGHLSVDIFLVDALQIDRDGARNILGLSAGLPGAAGLHGHARNGLVFQTTNLGEANEHVGLIMAHEIGHYLGLRHTTELVHGTDRGEQVDKLLGSTDPIKDTPVCEDILEKVRSDPSECRDRTNLMFPVAPRPSQNIDPGLTGRQGKAMTWNPLID